MTCHYCRFSNTSDEHRCRRCGRRLSGPVYSSAVEQHPDSVALPQSGANALAPRPALASSTPAEPQGRPAARTDQPSLFSEAGNVIPIGSARRVPAKPVPQPFSELVEPSAQRFRPVGTRPEADLNPPPRKPRADSTVENLQTAMDFQAAGSQSARMLKTTVEAVIYCDAPVAAPLHRVLAGALDASMILIGFGIFATLFHFVAGPILWNKLSIGLFAGTFGLMGIFYGLIWAIAGRESIGMRTLQLKLINFDGFPPDGRSRALRLAGTVLGFCSLGLGLIWALVDEEDLGWHDHMSKTFPTIDEGRGFLRAR